MNADTQVIPGHGALSNREDVRSYGDALVAMRAAVAELAHQGMPLDRIQAARPIQAQARAWGQDRAAEDSFVATLHHGILESGR